MNWVTQKLEQVVCFFSWYWGLNLQPGACAAELNSQPGCVPLKLSRPAFGDIPMKKKTRDTDTDYSPACPQPGSRLEN